MQIPTQITLKTTDEQVKPLDRAKSQALNLGALGAIVLLAAGLRLTNLDSLGLANHYYAAAVKSMLESWHNFFFVAAEPGGSVSVDKPPVGLWLQAISARIFGVNTIGLLLPELLAGLLSVVLVYYLVKRKFGAPAGLLAALVLAITPVVVATDRNNTMDSTLIFTLLLAAWAFIKATETPRIKYLLLGAALVGIAFNIKMLEAYLPLPAFTVMYLLGAPEGLWRKVGKLLLTAIVLFVISLSWSVAVDLTPVDQRPYVGSSGDNSEMSLIIGYNGIERLLGMFGGQRRDGSVVRPNNGGLTQPNNGSPIPLGGNTQPDGASTPPNGGFPQGGFQPGSPNNPNRTGVQIGASRGGAFSSTGQAGALRLFIPPLSKEVSWLLPFGLFSLILLVVVGRFSWPIGSPHQAVILWGGWLITAGIFFSIAGFFHEYYLSTLAPPLAALVGIGISQTWRISRQRLWLGGIIIVVVTALTLVLQYNTAKEFVNNLSWLPMVMGIFSAGAVLILAANIIRHPMEKSIARMGFTCLVAAMLITPGIWSGLTNLHSSDNQSLPAAYDGRSNGPTNSGLIQVDIRLLEFLQANTQGMYYLMAVPSSMQGADYILATGRPVLYMGGFMGQDQVLTADSLASLVNEGKLRFIYWNATNDGRGGGSPISGQSGVTNWVSGHCTVVQGYNTLTHNTGAPDGINGGTGNDGFLGGAQSVVLYDCGQ